MPQLTIRFELDDRRVRQWLETLQGEDGPAFGGRVAEQLMEQTLERTIALTPVDTGRARRGWQAAQSQLAASGAAIAGGGEGSLTRDASRSVTSLAATNGVPYIVYLEYGTRKMPPHAMVRRSLAAVGAALAGQSLLKDGFQ